ncbi:MAG: NAD-binding protein [Sulfurimonas sp.]
MNILIAGAGQVGFNLARTLSIGNNVTVIDQNEKALHRIQESLDILPLHGNVENSTTYEGFKHTKIDLFIAVTNIDNVNLIATMIANSILDIDKTFVRLQKYFKDIFIIKEKLGVDEIIFPTRLASKSVASLLNYPKANNVKFFKYTKNKLISLRVSQNFHAKKIESDNFIKVGIERNKDFFIPDEDEIIMPNDLVYFFGAEEKIQKVCSLIDNTPIKNIQKCVVYGGDELGIAIAKVLLEAKKDVKVIEKNMELCEIAERELQGEATVINAKYSARDIFEEENLSNADIFIATTKNDEFNIIKCLEAKERGIQKIVAINNDMEYYNLMHSLGIIASRGPKVSAYNKIMEELSSQGVVIQKSFCGSKAVILLRKIYITSKYLKRKIKPIAISNIKIYYIREEKLYPLQEKILMHENDIIIAFATTKTMPKVKKWIYEL